MTTLKRSSCKLTSGAKYILVLSSLLLSVSFSPLTGFADELQACQLGEQFKHIVQDTLDPSLDSQAYGYAVGVLSASGSVLCQETVNYNQNIYPASTIKSLIAFALMRKIDQGVLGLIDVITIDQVNADQECGGECSAYGYGKKRTIEALLYDMITVSNNLAANQLMDVVGKAFINDTADLIGASELRVYRKVYASVDPEPNNKQHNRASAAGFFELYREISTGKLGVLSLTSRKYLVHVFEKQKINSSFNSKFPSSVTFFHKTGSTSTVTADGGFYFLPSGNIVILVGLQKFRKFERCRNSQCEQVTGFQSLGEIGIKTHNWLKFF